MFPIAIVDLIGKASPWLAELMGGQVAGAVGDLVSTVLGGASMIDPESLARSLGEPGAVDKLKSLEMQLKDLQDARMIAQKETGFLRYQRFILALMAMAALVADIYAIQYVTDKMLNEILIMMLVFLIWDIRQIYKFFFGSSDDLPDFIHKKK